MPTYLAFDLGLAHTGVAISHEGLSEGLTTLHTASPDQLLSEILNLSATHQPEALILGCPSQGPIHQLATHLQTTLADHLSVPVHLVNEDQTTLIAQRAQIQSGVSRHRRQVHQHQAAAAAILETFLDNLLQ